MVHVCMYFHRLQIGHLSAPSIAIHFPDEAPTHMLTFGTVDGPAPPEHLRCSMAQHDTFAQAVTLSWTSAHALVDKRRREANQRLQKHHHSRHSKLFYPHHVVEDDVDDEDFEFGSSSSDSSEDLEQIPEATLERGTPVASTSSDTVMMSGLDRDDDIMDLVYAMDTTKLRDLETIENEVARVAARPVKAADYHIIEMRVLSQDTEDVVEPTTSYLYDQGDKDFVSIAELSREHSQCNINISQYPNSCLQFRVRAATHDGIRGEPSVVLAFFTPRIFRHDCAYRVGKEPFASRTGLFYQLGTNFGMNQVFIGCTMSYKDIWIYMFLIIAFIVVYSIEILAHRVQLDFSRANLKVGVCTHL